MTRLPLILLLGACLPEPPSWPEELGQDTDGDGSPDVKDCAPFDPSRYPGAPELCDGVNNSCGEFVGGLPPDEIDDDEDGFVECEWNANIPWAGDEAVEGGGDCDDSIAELYPRLWFEDRDEDGYGVDGTELTSCTPVRGYATRGGDCRDEGGGSTPSYLLHEDTAWFLDCDGDGDGGTLDHAQSCEPPTLDAESGCAEGARWTLDASDCDDADPTVGAGMCRWHEVDIGDYLACGIRLNGHVECWGYGTYHDDSYDVVAWTRSFTPPPDRMGFDREESPIDSVKQIDVSAHPNTQGGVICAIREADRALACWGEGDRLPKLLDPERIPAGPISKVSLGSRDGCALDADGALHCWGQRDSGHPLHSPPNALGRVFVDVEVAVETAVAVDTEGALYVWGLDNWMQDDGDSGGLLEASYYQEALNAQLHTDERFVRGSVTAQRICGFTSAGRVLCVGDAYALSDGAHEEFEARRVQEGWELVDGCAGHLRTCGVTADARLVCSSNHYNNQDHGSLDEPGPWRSLSCAETGWSFCALQGDSAGEQIVCFGELLHGLADYPY